MSKRSRSDIGSIVRTVSAGPAFGSKGRAKRYGKMKKIKSNIPKGMKSFVARTLQSLAEKKTVVSQSSFSIESTQVGQTPSFLNCVPRIAQGSAQNQRTGNDIRVTSGIIRGHISLNGFNATTNPAVAPVLVKMWLCRYKQVNTVSLLQTNADVSFFEALSGNTTGFSGDIGDMDKYPNQDSWEWLETKEVKVGVGSTSNQAPTANTVFFDNSSAVAPFEFNLGRHLRGATTYIDNDSTIPTNKNLFVVFQAVYAFPYSTTDATGLANCSYVIKHEYTDN